MVNIHPSLLPEGRGAWPMPVTLLKGLRESGITIHKITEGFDEGDILLQKAVPVMPADTLQILTARLQTLLPDMMAELASDFAACTQWRALRERENTGPARRKRIIRLYLTWMSLKQIAFCGLFMDMNVSIETGMRSME